VADSNQADADSIRSSALWHFHDFDADEGTASLLQLTEAAYRQASFLDQRVEPQASARRNISMSDLENALAAPGGHEGMMPAANFIFHHGHCGSTLLSRALAAPERVLPLREPLTLRRLAADSNPEGLLRLTLAAHSRTFRPRQMAIVKATSTCNSLIQPILKTSTESRAILIFVPLESFLAGMLGKQSPALDLKGHAAQRHTDWKKIHGAPEITPEQLPEAYLAVLAWLTSMNLMLAAARELPERTRLLSFEDLLIQPESRLEENARFIGLDHECQMILDAWPDISTGYSKKPDEPYSAFNRRRTLQRGRLLRGDEIRSALAWARELVSDVTGLEETRAFFGE